MKEETMKKRRRLRACLGVRLSGLLLALALVLASCQGPAGEVLSPGAETGGTETAAAAQESGGQAASASEAGNTASSGESSSSGESGSSGGAAAASGELAVHFLDVGQADCTLLVCDGEAMVIDAGNNGDANAIKEYLYGQGISELKYAVGTHPHEDHIGSMDMVVGLWPPESLFLPQVEADSETFRDVLHAAEEKEVPITRPVIGQTYSLGGGSFTILGPLTDYGENLNDWSVVLKFTYGDCSFLFSGDAEAEAEGDLCDSGQDLSADVYQVGHHGSSTSTSQEFLDRVSPAYAVISCGADNDYGHPHQETLDRLATAGAEIFRTDEQGTIVAHCDGQEITWSAAPSDSLAAGAAPEETTLPFETVESVSPDADYVLNTRSKKFHLPDCSSVGTIAKSNYQEFSGDRQELLDQGYSPCGNCQP